MLAQGSVGEVSLLAFAPIKDCLFPLSYSSVCLPSRPFLVVLERVSNLERACPSPLASTLLSVRAALASSRSFRSVLSVAPCSLCLRR